MISRNLTDLKCGKTYPVKISYSGNYDNISKEQNITVTYYTGFYTSMASN